MDLISLVAFYWIDIIGYTGAALMILMLAMRTMIPLRGIGICNNVLSALYGALAGVYPMLIQHTILLPINSWRLFQMLQLTRRVKAATLGDLNMDWLKPFSHTRHVKAGEIIFRKGDTAEDMFFIASGRFMLAEMGIEIEPGHVVGELAMVAPDRSRTQTLGCVESGDIIVISYDQIMQIYYQNPKFGFYFLQLISRRLFENIARLENEVATLRKERKFGGLAPAAPAASIAASPASAESASPQ
jgi:CRP/FNR family transcriptional regulator, cyclic AMP receptor protein